MTRTRWGASHAPARPIRPATPCRDCGHHPGDHKGYAYRGSCTLCAGCQGYRDTGPGITEARWVDPDWWPR